MALSFAIFDRGVLNPWAVQAANMNENDKGIGSGLKCF